MQFDLTDDQRAIQDTARDFLAARYRPEEIRRLALDTVDGFTQEGWDAIADLGWPGLVVPEGDGGLGLGAVELCVIQEQLGYALAPTPFLSTVAGGLLLAAGGTEAQRERWLAPLAEGTVRATVACWDAGSGQRSPRASALEPDGTTLTGVKTAVTDAGTSDVLVVTAAGGRLFAVDRRGPGVAVEPAESLDPTRKLSTVRLDGARAEELDAGDPRSIDLAWHTIVTATAAESVGVAQRAMEMAVRYASERRQFGRPIGAYQAVSHACAQMLLEVEGARSTVLHAAWAIDNEPQTAPLAASMAKAYAGDAGWRVPASALQVHGGIGFTWEHDLHFWLRRGKANQHHWGDSRHHRELVAQLAGV